MSSDSFAVYNSSAASDEDIPIVTPEITPEITPKNWPTTAGGASLEPAIEARIDDLMATMSIEDMVGQTIQADISSVTPEDIRHYRLGAILNGGNSAPGEDIRAPAEAWLALADEFYAASVADGFRAIPILWGTDAVHGHNNIVGATIFPHNIGLGAARNPDLIQQIGAITAREVIVTGMDWTFAPTLAVARDGRWGRTYESYSEQPEIVAQYAAAMVNGLQGELGTDDFLGDRHILATAKHFIGDGGTHGGQDQGDNIESEADLLHYHGAGYVAAIATGVQTIMASFSSWHGQRMHGHKALLTDVLKDRMGFNGFVVGDWNGHAQIPGCSTTSCPTALNAGIDMFMAPNSWRQLHENTVTQVKTGDITRARLDDAVRRILRVKFRLGLFEKPQPSHCPLAGNYELLSHPSHRAVARQAVRESLVLLKNQDHLLPLETAQTVLVVGDGADNISQQTGGWTLSWQGTGNTNEHFPQGTSIWAGIQNAVEAGGGNAILSPDGRYEHTPDVAIVVFGEAPYAEFRGDLTHLNVSSERTLGLLQSFRAAEIPTVAVFLSGRPLWVTPEINAANSFVAAWLPGSEGAGVADVLFCQGSDNVDFRGKLSFSWPRTAARASQGENDYTPLFPYGYGLTYGDNGNLAQLPETSGLDGSEKTQDGALFALGRPVAPWSLQATVGNTSNTTVDPRTQLQNALTMRSIDRAAQEDARQFVWSGQDTAAMVMTGPATSPRGLVIQYRVDTPPAGPVTLFSQCGDDGRASLDVTQMFADAPVGEWTQTVITLEQLTAAGPDNLTALGLETAAPFVLSLSDIRWVQTGHR